MSEAYFTNWLVDHAGDDRNRFHETALHEARVATELRAAPAAPSGRTSLVDRLRAAVTRARPAERCDCAVAA